MRANLLVLVLVGFIGLLLATAVVAKPAVTIGDPDDESLTKPTLLSTSVTGDPDDEDFTYPDGSKWRRIKHFVHDHGLFILLVAIALWCGPGNCHMPF
jgi:hypothetical protein